jgi:hypothetical protein
MNANDPGDRPGTRNAVLGGVAIIVIVGLAAIVYFLLKIF